MAPKQVDPLEPGFITGQNPRVSEKLPGETDAARDTRNENDVGGRPAFVFASGDELAASFDSSGSNLPAPQGGGRWRMAGQFTLGVHDVAAPGIEPEAILAGMEARGFHIWPRPGHP